MQHVELRVESEGEVILAYTFTDLRSASEMFAYLKDFFPDGTFIIQPLRH